MKPGRAVASFDSATGMLRALSRYLAGRDTPLIGQASGAVEPALSLALGAVNRLPSGWADRLYAASGVAEAVPRDRVGEIDAEALASWVVGHYPRRRYPVVFVGSSNGALVHLAAALGAPWLPQTLLIPVRRKGVDRDDAQGELDAGIAPGQELLDANPDLVLHHMHDPNQDRLMIAGMSYFRVKWRRLPVAYRRFVHECLQAGGVVVTAECELHWPVTRVADRHVFQFGAFGGATEDEYHWGGPRVADLLARYGANRNAWHPPAADERCPEAEWGFDPAVLEDLRGVAAACGCGFRRLRFGDPEQASPVVADLYRQWYDERGISANRLLAECFLLLEPWWTLRTGSVPFWMAFNTEGSLRTLNTYLDGARPYDEIRVVLFSHGTESIGLASAQDWDATARRGRKIGSLVGVDQNAFPRDFASLARAHRELARIRHLHDMPGSLHFSWVEDFLRVHTGVEWTPG